MKNGLAVFVTLAFANIGIPCPAQENSKVETKNVFFAGANFGGALAFGDDSYNVFTDFKNANGTSMSIFLGKDFSKMFSARLNARYQRLYSRVNLETLALRDQFPDKYFDMFPRDGFYGYDCYGIQADAMLNLINFIPNRTSDIFNLYVMGGLGANVACNYSRYSEWWSWESGYLDAGWYEVDRNTHIMPTAMIGGILDFKLCRILNLDFQIDCTFTGDNLEGVVSEEFYDAYITYSIGLTAHF